MNAGVPVRRAGPEDAATCARIVHGWVTETGWMPELHSVEALTAMIGEAMPDREIWLAGDPAEGYLSLDPATATVGALYTARPGKGLGKALLDVAKAGRDHLQLWTHEPNAAAHRFYRREGFGMAGETRDGDDGLVELRMEWRR